MKLIQLDVDAQQVLLGNYQTGIQALITINMENLIDGVAMNGETEMAIRLGQELIDLLKTDGSLSASISPHKHINAVIKDIEDTLDDNKYTLGD